jgi:hypothetical protein
VTVEHCGSLTVADIKTHTTGSSTHSRPGNILLDGGDASGDMTVDRLVAYNLKTGYISGSRPVITVSGYRDVTIGEIQAYCMHASDGRACNLTVTNGIAGSITITGPIDLSHGGVTDYRGAVQLTAGETIALSELDVDKVRFASFSTGQRPSEIDGPLDNFDTGHTGGSGSVVDPFVTTQTALRASVGQKIHYKVKHGENAYLDGKAYRIADPDGNAGQGGILMAKPARGTVVTFR